MVYNGGLVPVITVKMMNNYVNRYHSHLLLNHRSRKYHHVIDKLIEANDELMEVLNEVKRISVKWYKSIKGRLVGLVLLRYMMSLEFGVYRVDKMLCLYSNYIIIVEYMQRIVGVLTHNYDFNQGNKYYSFTIQSSRLYSLSVYIHEELSEVANDMLVHYDRLMGEK